LPEAPGSSPVRKPGGLRESDIGVAIEVAALVGLERFAIVDLHQRHAELVEVKAAQELAGMVRHAYDVKQSRPERNPS
jgi:hypothetical protein